MDQRDVDKDIFPSNLFQKGTITQGLIPIQNI